MLAKRMMNNKRKKKKKKSEQKQAEKISKLENVRNSVICLEVDRGARNIRVWLTYCKWAHKQTDSIERTDKA